MVRLILGVGRINLNMKKFSIITAVAISMALLMLVKYDSHNTNLRYLLWKNKIIDVDKESTLRYMYLMEDREFRRGLCGKRIDDISWHYPEIKAFGNGNAYQKYYEK